MILKLLPCLLFIIYFRPLQAAEAQVPLIDMIQAGGFVGYTIILISIVCLTLAIQLFLHLHKEKQFLMQLDQQFPNYNNTQQHKMSEWCVKNPSLIASLLQAGIEAADDHRETAVQEEAQLYTGQHFRKTDYLLFIGNTAPMLGLLGTVFGMMASFNVIAARSGSADPGELAGGISEALVTTCLGLLVALPALIFYTIIRNKTEQLVSDSGRLVDRHLFPERKKKAVSADHANTSKKPARQVVMPEKEAPETTETAESTAQEASDS